MLSMVPNWTVMEWSAAIQAGGAVMGALATGGVALIVHQWSVRQARQAVTQEINLALRTYNLAALTEPELMAVVQAGHRTTYSLEEMKQLFHVHYRLSVLNDIFESRRNGILPRAFSLYGFDEWIFGLCRTYRTALDRALADPRGQSPEFLAHVRKRVLAYDLKHPRGATEQAISLVSSN